MMKKLRKLLGIVLAFMFVAILPSCSPKIETFKIRATTYEEGSIVVGNSLPLVINIEPKPKKDPVIDWMTTNPSIASFDGNKLKGLKIGEVEVQGRIGKTYSNILKITVRPEACVNDDHEFGDVVVTHQPKCLTNGLGYKVCTKCLEKVDVQVPALDHDWRYTNNVEPTCTTSGTMTRVCNRCNVEETKDFEPLGHKFPASIVKLTFDSSAYESDEAHRVSTPEQAKALIKFDSNADDIKEVSLSSHIQSVVTIGEDEYPNVLKLGSSNGSSYINLKFGQKYQSITFDIVRFYRDKPTSLDVNGKQKSIEEYFPGDCLTKQEYTFEEPTDTFYISSIAVDSEGSHVSVIRGIELALPTGGVKYNEVEPLCTVDGGYDTGKPCERCGLDNEKVHTSIPATGHDFTSLVSRVEPTCLDDGFEAHYECNNCDAYFDLEKNEVAAADLTIAARGSHNFVDVPEVPSTCDTKGTSAYQRCLDCGYETDFEVLPYRDHEFGEDGWCIYGCGQNIEHIHIYLDYTSNNDATCTSNGTKTGTCRCGETNTIEDEGSMLPHSSNNDEAQTVKYTFTGVLEESKNTAQGLNSNGGFYIINSMTTSGTNIRPVDIKYLETMYFGANGGSDPNKYVNHDCIKLGSTSAAGSLTFIFDDNLLISKVTIKATGWDLDTAELDVNGISYKVSSLMAKEFNPSTLIYSIPGTNTLTISNTNKKPVCIFEIELEYIYENVKVENYVGATCKEEGSYDLVKVCYDCGAIISTTHTVINTYEHDYKATASKAATCTTTGNKLYYTCNICSNVMVDDSFHPTTLTDMTIPAKGHSFGEWIAQVDATCEQSGVLGHKVCSTCEKNFDEDGKELGSLVIAKSAHTYVDGICDVCGAEKPVIGEQQEYTTEFLSKGWTAKTNNVDDNWTQITAGSGFTANQGLARTAGECEGKSTKEYKNVTKVEVKYCTNKSAGAGTITVTIGSEVQVINVKYSGSDDGRTIQSTILEFDAANGVIDIKINTTTNSLYLNSIVVTAD